MWRAAAHADAQVLKKIINRNVRLKRNLAGWRRPLASLNADYPTFQRHLGWTFGYFTGAASTKLEQLVWQEQENKWGCADAAYEFPSMRPGKPP